MGGSRTEHRERVSRRSRSVSGRKNAKGHCDGAGSRHVATAARAGSRLCRSRSRSYRRGRNQDDERSERHEGSKVVLTARDRQHRGNCQDSMSNADGPRFEHNEASVGNGKGKGGRGHGHHIAPLPRPGHDDDGRFQHLEDDPRYFPGAEIGKAQKAAMGIKGLAGRNTASFYPESTLVRPAMRVYYGAPQKRYEKPLKPDDVVVVPDFFCKEGSLDAYHGLLDEIRLLGANSEADLGDLPISDGAVKKLCKYFAIQEDGRALRLAWHRSGSDKEPVTHDVGKFGKRLSKTANCVATMAFGATRELAFLRSQTDECIFFPQVNGALTFFGRDVCLRWRQGMNLYPQQASSKYDHISITVMGNSLFFEEETYLAKAPSDEKHGEDAFDGRWNVSFRDVARPAMRVITAPPRERYGTPLKHDDVVVVPEFFCTEDDWDIYYKLLKEIRQSQTSGIAKAEWVSWHEGAHLLSHNPTGSRTYQQVVDKMCDYFSIAPGNRGTRFNWYRDGSDWKPFHHDSAAFNEQRAKTQNTTIGVSFGDARELAFRHAKTGELIYFPQKNGMLFYFGRDANIVWQHGINALPQDVQGGKGRISIILWGLCTTVIDEVGSPPMLTDDSRGKGKGKGKGGFSIHADDRSQQPCRDFKAGRCSYGERCRFSHDLSVAAHSRR